MNVYLLWVGAIFLILTIYSIILWQRSAKGYRFQARLTILFLLFILVPAIPLTLFVSAFVTQNTEFLLLPGIELTFEKSLLTIKTLAEERADLFCQNYPDVTRIRPEILKQNRIAFLCILKLEAQELIKIKEVSTLTPPIDICVHLNADDFSAIQTGELKSTTRQKENAYYFEVYYPINAEVIKVIGFQIDEQIVATREQITSLLRLYKFQEKIIDPNLIWTVATLFIILLALLAIFTARKFSKGLSGPIQQLTQAMKKVAAGDLATPVEIVARDEIKFLVDAFNKMIQDLNISQQKLIQSERIAAWRDVARRISHEIKNPLTPIQMAFYRLRTKISIQPADREVFDKSIATMNEEIESLRRLADEFSQFARMPQPQREAVNLNEILRSTVILFEAEPHQARLKLELSENLPAIALDREQIKRVLNNLLKNSVEASPLGGVIVLRTEPSTEPPHRVCLKLMDHGQGIPPERLDKIFEPYFSTKESGRGLGLSIVKRIVEDHEGKIIITSKMGVGTEVTIWL